MSELYAHASGTLSKDAEIKSTKGGKDYLALSLSAGGRKTDGGWEGSTWVNVQNYGDFALKLVDDLTKGTFVAIRGKLSGASYVNKGGELIQQVHMFADGIQFPREKVGAVAKNGTHSKWTAKGTVEEAEDTF
jgi:single-stranded DNA-binding protein